MCNAVQEHVGTEPPARGHGMTVAAAHVAAQGVPQLGQAGKGHLALQGAEPVLDRVEPGATVLQVKSLA